MQARLGVARRTVLIFVSALLCFETISSGTRLQIPSGTWAGAASLIEARAGAASVLLNDGRLLITGGESTPGRDPLATAETYASDDVFAGVAPMLTPRKDHIAVVLKDGRVLVAGGTTAGKVTTPAAEIYDPASDSWTQAGDLVDARSAATATLLDDGRVLIAGGQGVNGVLTSLEIFDPVTASFSFVAAITPGRKGHSASLLPDGTVAIAGGFDGTSALSSVEIFDPETGEVASGPELLTPRTDHSATTLPGGSIVFIGGSNGAADLASAEIYNPTTQSFSAAPGALAVPRRGHQAFFLPHNNHVLVTGGTSDGHATAVAELFVPWTGLFQATGAPAVARAAAAGGALKDDGLLLVAGGRTETATLSSAELYGFATVKTDKDDYAPNETLTITGSGWEPGESVSLLIHEVPAVHEDIVVPVLADSFGRIFENDYVFEPHQFGVRFTLTATGTRSEAQTTFTDARQFTASITPTTTPTGNPTAFTLTVANASALGEVMDCLRITIPSGAGTPGLLSVEPLDPGANPRSWSSPSISAGVITTARIGSATNSIDPGGTVAVHFTTTATTADSKTWTTTAFGATDCSSEPFAIIGDQPVVDVTAGTGNIVIIKHAAPQDPQDFSFTTSGGLTPSSFSLDDDGDVGEGALPNTQTFSGLAAGTYTVTEMSTPGWDLTPVKCVDPSGGTQIFGATASIDLLAGETVTCTYTNTKRGSIVVEKQTLPDASPGTFTFTGTAAGTIGDNGQISVASLVPGTYTATESDPGSDFDLTSIVCDDAGSSTPSSGDVGTRTATFHVDPGETVKCTFTNSKRGTIVLKKSTAPLGAPGSFGFSSALAGLTGSIGDGGTLTALHVSPGTYTATENSPGPGFDLTAIACDDGASTTPSAGDVGTRTVTYHVDPGETVTCTFTNTQRGTVIVQKQTTPLGALGSFGFTSGLAGLTGSIGDGGTLTQTNVAPGTYTAAENDPTPAFDLSAIVCDDGSSATPSTGNIATRTATFHVDPGETVKCTFTNVKRGTIILEKQTLPDGALGSFTFTGSAAGTISDNGQITVANLAPGTYSATESDPTPAFDLTSIVCDDGGSLSPSTGNVGGRTVTFNLDPGETVRCTFTDTARGTLIVEKQTAPDGAPGSFEFTSPVTALNGMLSDNGTLTAPHVVPGTYTATESNPGTGFDVSEIICDDVSSATPSSGDTGTRTATFHLDPGETVRCTFTNTQRGSVVLEKHTLPEGAAGTFTFTSALAGLSGAIGDLGTLTQANVTPGAYTVTETDPAPGFDLTAITCDDGTSLTPSSGNVATRTVTFEVDPGETVHCTVTNTKRGTAILEKQTTPHGALGSFGFTSALGGLTGSIGDGGTLTQTSLMPGTYTTVENDPAPGFDLTSIACDDGASATPSSGNVGTRTVAFHIDPGETVHCTVTNTARGTVIVEKQTTPHGPGSFAFTSALTGLTGSVGDGGFLTQAYVTPGTYTATESDPTPAFDLTAIVCDDGSSTSPSSGDIPSRTATFHVDPGETVRCTFTNTKRGTIIVEKQTLPDAASGSFTFTGTAAGSVSDNGQISVANLAPGTYTSTETDPSPAFDLTAIVCDDSGSVSPSAGSTLTRTATFHVDPGETVKCTFTNTKRGTAVLTKQTVPSGAAGSFAFTSAQAGLTGSVADGGTLTQLNLMPGTYTAVESDPTPGFDLTSIVCDDGASASPSGGDLGTRTVAFHIDPGETVHCSVTNTARGSVIVEKQTLPDAASGSFSFTSALGGLTGSIGDNGTLTELHVAPGTYTATESDPTPAFDLTSIACDDGASASPSGGNVGARTATFHVDPGETVKCTFTDTKRGTAVLQKQTVPTGAAGSFGFTSSQPGLTGSVTDGGVLTQLNLMPGTYSAVESDPTPGFDVTAISCDDGSSASPSGGDLGSRTVTFHIDPGETVHCTVTNTARGTLIVEKQTLPDAASGSFAFTSPVAGLTGSIGDGGTLTALHVGPGTYTATEGDPTPAFDLTSIVCDDGGSASPSGGDIGTRTATFHLDPGETIKCTFTDTKRGVAILQKQTAPAGAPGSFTFTSALPGLAGSIGDGGTLTALSLIPGSYTTVENDPAPGFDVTSIACDDGASATASGGDVGTRTVTFHVDPGETVHCTVTNTARGTIVVEKQTLPDAAPGSFTFTGTAAGTVADNGQITVANLAPGTYTSTETDPTPVFDLSSIVCDDGASATPSGGDLGSRTATFHLDPGETIHCTFTNTKRGTAILAKQTVPAGAAGSFAFTSAQAGLTGSVGDGGVLTQLSLAPGTYTTVESDPAPGFDLTSIVCDDGASASPSGGDLGTRTVTFHIDPGETVHCTATNTARGTLIVEKQTLPDAASGSFAFTSPVAGLTGSIGDGGTLTALHVTPGTYTATENDPTPAFDLTSIVCDDGGSASPSGGDIGTRTATFHLEAGETIKCTFTDTKRGVAIVQKQTVPTGAPGSFTFTSGLPGLAGSIGDGGALTALNLMPGTYTAVENDPAPGFDLTAIACDDGASASPSGGDLGTRTVTFHVDPGETVHCTVTNTKRGTIVVEKQTLPDGAPGSFTFTGTAAGTIPDNGQITVGGLAPGTYTSTETDPSPAFDLTAIVCDDGASASPSSGNVGTRTATFHVDPGETIHCTFTNTARGTLIVEKQTLPDAAGGSFAFTSPVAGLTGSIADNGMLTALHIMPGTYTATESDPTPAFDLTSIVCDDGGSASPSGGDLGTRTATFHLDPGETIKCTFTDTKRGVAILQKQTVPAGAAGSFTFTSAFPGLAGSIGDGGALTALNLMPGTYTAVENDPTPGFDLTSIVCDDGASASPSGGDLGTRTVTFQVDPGETVHCTVTNTKRGGIIVEKQTLPDAAPGSFTFTGAASGSIGDNGQISVANLAPGTYTTTESDPGAGFDLTAIVCNDGSSTTPSTGSLVSRTATFHVDPGETVTCVFTNTARGAAVLTKQTVPSGASGSFNFTSALAGLTGSVGDGGSLTELHVAPGTYTAIESDPTPGFELTSIVCDDGASASPSAGDLGTRTITFHVDPGETVHCTVTNTAKGTVILEKQTLPDGAPGSFSFASALTGLTGSIGDNGTLTELHVAPGTYTAAEGDPTPAFDLTSIVCDDGASVTPSGGDLGTRTATFHVDPGETVKCTFTDTKRGAVVLAKQTVPTGAAGSFAFTSALAGLIGSVSDGGVLTQLNLMPGTYTAVETDPTPGFDLSAIVCDDGASVTPSGGDVGARTVTFHVDPGETVHCMVTNTARGTAVLTKQTVPGGASGTFGFTSALAGLTGSVGDGGSLTELHVAPGAYTAIENDPSPAYELTAIVCDDGASVSPSGGDVGSRSVTFHIEPGETVHCTVTNTARGTVIIKKQTLPAAAAGSFNFTSTLAGLTGSIGDGGTLTQTHLGPGTYTAAESDPGPGFDLTSIVCDDGSSATASSGDLSTRTATFRVDAGETVTCTFTNRKRGSIIVEKQTLPDGAPGSFTFTGAAAGTVSDNGQITVANLVPGLYTATETDPAPDFDLTSLACDDGSSATPSTGDVGSRTATFQVEPGETVRCTFTDTKRGTLIVEKQTVPDNAAGTFGFTSSLAGLTGSIGDNGTLTQIHLAPGAYSVMETDPSPAFDLTDIVCDDGSSALPSGGDIGSRVATFRLDPGETVRCTFTDTKRGHLIVDKVTNPSGDPTSFSFHGSGGTYGDFGLTDAAPPNDQLLVPGTYSIAETVPAGWDLSGAMCVGGPFGAGGAYVNGAPIALDAGQVITCTFTDTKRAHLVVDKVTSPGGDPTSFAFHAGGAGYSDFSLTDAAPPNDQVLLPGTYSVTETVPAGWTLAANCVGGPFGAGGAYTNGGSIALGAGQVVTCTFTDTKVIVPTGTLVAAYSFNEGHGDTAHDSSGFENDGTVCGPTWTTSGKYGKALSFDGVNDYVTVADDTSLDLTTGMTLEAWVKPTSLTGWRPILYKERPLDPGVPILDPAMSYALYASDLSAPPSVYAMTTAGSDEWFHALGTSKIPLNTWTHIAGTYDGTSLKLYVNGTLVKTIPRTGPMFGTMGPLKIGGSSVVTPWGSQFFKGLIDEIRVYSRALSQAEIQADRLAPLP